MAISFFVLIVYSCKITKKSSLLGYFHVFCYLCTQIIIIIR